MKRIITHFFLLGLLCVANTSIAQTWCTTGFYSSGCTFGDYIDAFSTTGGSTNITNNSSGCNGGTVGYTYFSTMTHTTIQGTTVNYSFTLCPIYSQGVKIWVDYNNNGSFMDAGEQVYASAATLPGSSTVAGNFTVPITTPPGMKRMRVRCVYAQNTFTDCNNHSFGEVEDYNLNVIAATPCSGQPTAGTASVAGTCPTMINLAGTTLMGNINVQWQSRPACATNWTNIPGATNFNYPVVSISQPTEFRAYVVCTNSGLADTTNIVSITSVIPCYCTSTATSAFYEDITNVTVASLNNNSTCGSGNGNQYTNFTALPPTTIAKGTSVPFSVTITNCGTFNSSNATAIFIDYNRNGTYDAVEKVAFTTTSSTGPNTFSGSFTVPATAQTGVTGMRVINASGQTGSGLTGCASYSYGETEDYLVRILYAPTATGGGTYCTGDTVTLIGSAPGLSNPKYLWIGPGGFSDTNAVVSFANLQLSQAGTYSLRVLDYPCGGTGIPDTSGSTEVVINVNQRPGPPNVAPQLTYCQGDVFDTIPIFGQNLKWYSVITGGVGTTIAPIVNTANFGTFTYYVSQTFNGCESPRAPVTFSIVPKPAPPAVVSPVVYCQSETPAPLMASGQNVRWYSVPTGGVGTTITPTPGTNAQGTFTWWATQTVAGCESDRAQVDVKVNYVPNALITISRPYVCQYDTITLSYFGNATTDADYLWTLPPGASIEDGSGQGPVVIRFDSAGRRRVKLQVDNGGCVGPETYLDVDVRLSPVLALDMQYNACQGELVHIAVSHATLGIDHHEWDFMGGVTSYGAQTSGPFGVSWNTPGEKVITVVATDNECKSLPVRDTIDIRPLPNAGFSMSKYENICAGDTIELEALYDPNHSYLWLPAQFFREAAGGHRQTAIVDMMDYITLHVTNEFNCKASDSAWVQAEPCCDIYFPNAFTPNGDGLNDLFRVIGPGKHHITSFRIHNRWGQSVFETHQDTKGWDGTFNGKPQDMGTYFYYIKYKCVDGNFYEDKGELILVR